MKVAVITGASRGIGAGDRGDAHASWCVFGGQRAGHGGESALCLERQRGRRAAVGVVDEAGGDVDYVAAALSDHLLDGQLRDVEEARQVHGGDCGIVAQGVIRERLADEDPRVVVQLVDPPEDGKSIGVGGAKL
jgi:hypothetical protein